jgi:hypothetical protein
LTNEAERHRNTNNHRLEQRSALQEPFSDGLRPPMQREALL